MDNTLVKAETEKVAFFLENVVEKMTNYMNSITILSLEDEGEGERSYLLELLRAARSLLVFCEEALDACRQMIRSPFISPSHGRQLFEKIYYQCIERFFHPKNDTWFEDSRCSYTNSEMIVFRQAAPPSFVRFIQSLEEDFTTIREEIDFGVQSHF
ncbi:DUF3907 family protein [Bacillus sp. AFS040349]|uniref:DUF3907 family protein n=1 Tax=Bacillus sp. AFS040349 TaxID=2033502 RepID=UPI000BFD3250|nr:DUF3907 family protein [Bacillus sp. AFS040349]PGT83760.1 hypothetical protein COD11_12305 [Bacillus sp. AFS040349]